uniref:Solute-binding protein family 5 domain-containing protein n=1 Tax=Bellilinea caldifistulae TaxID=360411 RepID=A0A7C4L0W8_9CHLR
MKNSPSLLLLRKKSFLGCVLLMLISLLVTACQPLSLQVEQVQASVNLQRIRAQDCSYGGAIRAVEALDSYKVRFTLCNPDPAFAAKLAFPVFAIQDDDYLNEHRGDSKEMSRQPNGSGPYRVAEYVPGVRLTLQPNPEYWGLPPRVESLTFRWASTSLSRLVEVSTEKAHVMDSPDPNSFYSINQDSSLSLVFRPALNVAFIGMNNRFAPFNDARVRQAISMLIDRERIVNTIYPVGTEVADQFISPVFQTGYTPLYQWLPYDPQQALDLLRRANFDFEQELTLSYPSQGNELLPDPHRIAQTIRSQLLPYGVNVRLNRMDAAAFEQSVRSGNEAFFLYSWYADYADPDSLYSTIFSSDAQLLGNVYPDVQFMAKEAGRSSDPDQRQNRYNRINEMLRMHVPAIPLAHVRTAVVFRQEVEGVSVNAYLENLSEVITPGRTLVFLQSAEPESLWPADATQWTTFRVTNLLYSTLVENEFNGIGLRPGLAESWSSNSNATEWTFNLRYGVRFTNGALLDANDVVASFAAIWDASNPNHKGDSGEFTYFRRFFGSFLNQP